MERDGPKQPLAPPDGGVTSADMGLIGSFTSVGQTILNVLSTYDKQIALSVMIGSTTGLVGIGAYLVKSFFESTKDLPKRSDKRERMANQLLARGHATVDELLEASYGDWPPKGLDLIDGNPQVVTFVDMLGMTDLDKDTSPEGRKKQREELANVGGRARVSGAREIGISPKNDSLTLRFTGRSALASLMGHETAHILQGDHYWRAHEIFEPEDAQEITMRMNDARSNVMAKAVFSSKNINPGAEFGDPEAKPLWKNLAYLSQGVEIQARMHQLMAEGYQQWGVMPTTKTELMVAMINMGLKVPALFRRELESAPDFERASETFKYDNPQSNRHVRSTMHALNYAQSQGLNDRGQKMFLNFLIPCLYGDLIEMYGDRYGLERFTPIPNRTRIYRENRMAAGATKWLMTPLEDTPAVTATGGDAPASPRPSMS